MNSLKLDGICPRCASDNIRSGAAIDGKEGLRGGNRIPLDAQHTASLDNYICLDCGYTESYISDRDALKRIEKLWPKVKPKGNEA
jgi:hypothetical protein